MRQTFHLLTGEFPPQHGGVGDYTSVLAQRLASRGCLVHVWCPSVARSERDGRVQVHKLPDSFGPLSRRALDAALADAPGCVLLQYVPNVLGARGANLPFCFWLRRLRRRDVDVRVMFHEPYFYFAWQHPLRNALAGIQRVMARVLLQASVVVYLSTETWTRYLCHLAPAGTQMVVTPIPSTVGDDPEADAVAMWRARFGDAPIVGHFGTFGAHLAAELRNVVPAILRADPIARFVCIGLGSEPFAALLSDAYPALEGRILATGALGSADISAALRACDLVVQPYPDGVTTRRTSVMAGLANGVATVTTAGVLTEPVWKATGAVALAPASDASAIGSRVIALLRDRDARITLGQRGRRAYDEHFALDRTIEKLLSPVGSTDREADNRRRGEPE